MRTQREVEQLTGLSRAKLRRYEDEGFIKPPRDKNGYREWDDENLAGVFAMLLFNSLGFTNKQIHAFEEETGRELGDILEGQIELLERKKREIERQIFAAKLVSDFIKGKEVDYTEASILLCSSPELSWVLELILKDTPIGSLVHEGRRLMEWLRVVEEEGSFDIQKLVEGPKDKPGWYDPAVQALLSLYICWHNDEDPCGTKAQGVLARTHDALSEESLDMLGSFLDANPTGVETPNEDRLREMGFRESAIGMSLYLARAFNHFVTQRYPSANNAVETAE